MKGPCQEAVEIALGRHLTPGEADGIEAKVRLHMQLLARKDPAEWHTKSAPERLELGANAAVQDMLAEVRKKAQRLQLQIAAHDRVENYLQTRLEERSASDKPSKSGSLLRDASNIAAFDSSGHGFTSAETWAHAIAAESIGRLMPVWNSVHGFLSLFENKAGTRDLQYALFGDKRASAAAREGAKAWLDMTDELRDRANAAGLDVGKLDEWRYPQSHDQAKVAAAGVNRWVEDALTSVDRSKYLHDDGTFMDDQEVRDILRNVYETITSDGVSKMDPGAPKGYGSTGNRLSQHRAVFFKDADAFNAYNDKYGGQNLFSTLTGHIRGISRDIALAETLGWNAKQTFDYFNDRALKYELALDPKNASALNAQHKLNQAIFDKVSGNEGVVNAKVRDAFQAFRNFETGAKLGQVVITALGDEATMAATAFANKIPWTEVFAREMHYLNPANSESRAIAAHAGLGNNAMLGNLNRFGSEDFGMYSGPDKMGQARATTAKVASGVLHLSGAEAMWDGRRRGLGAVLMSYLGKHVGAVEHFADINPVDHGVLANKGVSETDWQVWKLAELEDWGMKHGVLTPKAVWDIPDAKLAALAGEVAAKSQAERAQLGLFDPPPAAGEPPRLDVRALKRHAATMLLGHVLEETSLGVTDTGARERAIMTFGTKKGTYGGELVRSAMLFKGFSASLMLKHWNRATDLATAADRWSYGARLVVMSTILGAIAIQLRSMLNGQDPRNIAEPMFWGEAALRGGGLGFYGDFLYSELTSHDTSLIPALAGPLATETESIWNLTGAAAFKAARGERTDEGAKSLQWLKSNIPFLNMWYTRAAMNHILWNDMQEAASPGYLDRMQSRALQTKGTTWWWDPHEGLPSAGPDFSKLWQPDLGARQLDAAGQAVGIE